MQIVLLIDEWARAYDVPRSEIIRQLPWAHGWCVTNPKKAPKKNVVRFLFNWLRKANQMGNLKKARIPEKLTHELVDDAPLTRAEQLEMHQQTVKALKRCYDEGKCDLCAEIEARSVAA